MLREAFLNFDDKTMTLIGLIIFVTFFVGLFIWVYLPFKKRHYEEMSQLPLGPTENNQAKGETP